MSNTRKMRVFISYSHRNEGIQIALAAELRAKRFEVKVDTGRAHTQELHKEISANINWADVLVPIVTKEWLASTECRDELVRGHERRKSIIPFTRSDVVEEDRLKMPWYLQETIFTLWGEGELDRAIKDLIDRLLHVRRQQWRNDCYHEIRMLGDHVQGLVDPPQWQVALARQILATTRSQLTQILSDGRCAVDVSYENRYLRYAHPIFSNAKQIIAICIASISTFWTNPQNRSLASQYLTNQTDSAESVCRLFVFESARELIDFKEILQRHHESYGKNSKSGVFLCSAKSYRRLARRWSRDPTKDPMSQDFGLLAFEGSTKKMYATLDRSEFAFELYQPDPIQEAGNRVVEEQFRRFLGLAFGHADADAQVVRWSPDWYQNSSGLSSLLEGIFHDRPRPVRHFVLLRPQDRADPEFPNRLYGLAARFARDRESLRVRNVKVNSRWQQKRPIVDGRFAGVLLVDSQFQYILELEFEDEEALSHYYQHEMHSVERESLYCALNPAVGEAFNELDALPLDAVQQRAEIFARVERAMVEGGFVRRIDIWDDEPLSSVAQRTTTPRATVPHV